MTAQDRDALRKDAAKSGDLPDGYGMELGSEISRLDEGKLRALLTRDAERAAFQEVRFYVSEGSFWMEPGPVRDHEAQLRELSGNFQGYGPRVEFTTIVELSPRTPQAAAEALPLDVPLTRGATLLSIIEGGLDLFRARPDDAEADALQERAVEFCDALGEWMLKRSTEEKTP